MRSFIMIMRWLLDSTQGCGLVSGRTNYVIREGNGSHSSTLAWQIPWTEEPGGPQSMVSLRVGHDWALHFHFSLSRIGEGNGNPLQCSCLENPRDGGAWRAAVYGVAQSRTRLKWLSSSSSSSRQPFCLFAFLFLADGLDPCLLYNVMTLHP